MTTDEERLLEIQLEHQLQEQRDSLVALEEALASDPTNPELLSVREELISAVGLAEEGLVHLKRERLLREFDDSSMEKSADALMNGGAAVDLKFSVGSKCRFRFTDGCWYNGMIIAMDSPHVAKISFLSPTSHKFLMCKFFEQKRCRFGNNCRLSHGVDIPVSALETYEPVHWNQSRVGSTIWAVSGTGDGLWKQAELESWDEESETGRAVFTDGCTAPEALGPDAICLSRNAVSPDTSSSSGCFTSSDGEDEVGPVRTLSGHGGGTQTETVVFADWENHTRGVASRMMARMGYRQGMGLGVSGQGMVDPVAVRVDPSHHPQEKKRKRKKKKQREDDEVSEDVFTFINCQLSASGDRRRRRRDNRVDQQQGRPHNKRKDDRLSLVGYGDEMKEMRVRVERLEEMVERNKKDKVFREAAARKLVEARAALLAVQSAHASASDLVSTKDKEKRWLKF